MKGSRTLMDKPFRFSGVFSHDYDMDIEEWQETNPLRFNKCYCCGGKMQNIYSPSGMLLRREFPYIATFKITKGKYCGLNHFEILCRACAYDYGVGVIEMDGETYHDYYQFNEKQYKEQINESK